MLEILGKGYVIEHCVSFFQKEQKTNLLVGYITDALKAIVYNTGKHEDFVEIQKSYNELLEQIMQKEPQIEKTEEEVVSDIRSKLLNLT